MLLQPGRRMRGWTPGPQVDPAPDRAVTTYGDVRVAAPFDALIDSAGFIEVVGERRLRVAWDHLRWEGIVRARRLVLDGFDPRPGRQAWTGAGVRQ